LYLREARAARKGGPLAETHSQIGSSWKTCVHSGAESAAAIDDFNPLTSAHQQTAQGIGVRDRNPNEGADKSSRSRVVGFHVSSIDESHSLRHLPQASCEFMIISTKLRVRDPHGFLLKLSGAFVKVILDS
jgi:hypothetical protein